MKPTATVLVLALLAGCGDERPKAFPATGEVFYNNAPVEDAHVSFMPTGARVAYGTTDGLGRFELSTYGRRDGAVAGKHAVSVSKTVQADPNDRSSYPQMTSVLPEKYSNPATSGLEVVVRDDGENHFRLELTD